MLNLPLSMSARDRITWLLKWTGTVLTLIGAVLTSIDIQPYNVWLLNIGSAVFVAWAVRIRDGAMITVNLGLLTIYSVGVIIRL
jgi:hypothetical protein